MELLWNMYGIRMVHQADATQPAGYHHANNRHSGPYGDSLSQAVTLHSGSTSTPAPGLIIPD